MDYISTKVNTLTGSALSGINQMRRKRNNEEQTTAEPKTTDQIASLNLAPILKQQQTFSSGIAFGGDSYTNQQQPPPIGFRLDNLATESQANELERSQPERAQSDESLYESGDAWTRLWFQRVMALTLIRLMLFIRKVYEDYQATKIYGSGSSKTGHFLLSLATLFLPTIVFTIYRVSRYLQLTLPQIRSPLALNDTPLKSNTTDTRPENNNNNNNKDEDETKRALMSSPVPSTGYSAPTSPTNINNNEDDGLVTARQSPTNQEEFHDSKSQQELSTTAITKDTSMHQTVLAVMPESPVESFDVEKLGDLPDKDTTRVVIGASEQLLHGVLFIFWQLKRQVDVVGYLVERSCLWRKPRPTEVEQLEQLRTGSDGLEWFQDFYAAFLAILVQVYTLGAYWSGGDDKSNKLTTSNTLAGLSPFSGGDSTDQLGISNAAKAISQTLGHQAIAGNALTGKDLLVTSELIVSSAVVFSLLLAVRRRDDGPLTLGLSIIGWASIFSARIIVIALAFVHIGWRIMLAFVIVHILCIAAWIYKIAIDSHNGKASENEELKWRPNEEDLEMSSGEPNQEASVNSKTTSQWSIMEHLILMSQILTLFAIPSLFYWPIMFNLKLHYRPFKYLVLIMTQNFLLIPAIWFTIGSTNSATMAQWYLLGAVGAFSIVGFIFVSLYVACKPSLTEYFARADELFNEAQKSGIYYEFCARVFRMPDLSQNAFKRLMNQTEEIIEQPVP